MNGRRQVSAKESPLLTLSMERCIVNTQLAWWKYQLFYPEKNMEHRVELIMRTSQGQIRKLSPCLIILGRRQTLGGMTWESFARSYASSASSLEAQKSSAKESLERTAMGAREASVVSGSTGRSEKRARKGGRSLSTIDIDKRRKCDHLHSLSRLWQILSYRPSIPASLTTLSLSTIDFDKRRKCDHLQSLLRLRQILSNKNRIAIICYNN